MTLVQKVSDESTQIAFGSLASSLMAMVLLEGLDSSRINFVSYEENAIKNKERSVRGEVPGVEVVNITIPQLMKQ